MALNDPTIPYGLRDIKIAPIDASGTVGTEVDLPIAQTLSFSETEEFTELRGDDVVAAIHGQGPIVEWELEAGAVSLAAWKVLTGGTLSTTGTTPDQVKKLNKKNTDARPYFQIQGKAINDGLGDTHVVIYKAKCTDSLEGEFADGEFFITSCSGQGIGDADGDVWDFIWNETATDLFA